VERCAIIADRFLFGKQKLFVRQDRINRHIFEAIGLLQFFLQVYAGRNGRNAGYAITGIKNIIQFHLNIPPLKGLLSSYMVLCKTAILHCKIEIQTTAYLLK
jgi:hypothetical protein